MEKSKNIIGDEEYFLVYDQANDSINMWAKSKLTSYIVFSENEWKLDSLVLFNTQKEKCFLTIFRQCTININCNQETIRHFYGVKIKGNWYFFSGPALILPREYYQEDIHSPLSFEKMKQIAADRIYRGYLKKDKRGEWEINDDFFRDLTSNAWCGNCTTQEQWDSTYISVIDKNWQQRDTIY